MAGRLLDWPDCRNVRDLGGLPCATGLTRAGSVIRSDNVSSLNTEGIRAMWEYGVKAVLDLRSESEIARFPSPFEPADYGPAYIHEPLVDDAAAAKVGEIPSLADRYLAMIDHRGQALGRIFTTIARADGPLVFHCFAGKDRTGLVAALLLDVAGVPRNVIGADYAETDVHLAGRYAEWLASAPPERVPAMRDELRCPPEWMLDALAHVDDRWGGVERYLVGTGVQPDDLVRLKTKLAG